MTAQASNTKGSFLFHPAYPIFGNAVVMLCMSSQAKSNLSWIPSAWKHMAPPDLWQQNRCTPDINSVMPVTSRSTRKAFPWLVFWCLLAFCLTGRLSFCDCRLITALLCLLAPFPKVMGRELYHLPSFVLELLIITFTGTLKFALWGRWPSQKKVGRNLVGF